MDSEKRFEFMHGAVIALGGIADDFLKMVEEAEERNFGKQDYSCACYIMGALPIYFFRHTKVDKNDVISFINALWDLVPYNDDNFESQANTDRIIIG